MSTTMPESVKAAGLQKYIQRTQKQVAPLKPKNASTQKMLSSHLESVKKANSVIPQKKKTLEALNAPRPTVASADIAAPIQAARSINDVEESVLTPELNSPVETQNPEDETNAIDDMGAQSNQGAELVAAQRRKQAGLSQGGEAGGEFTGGNLGDLDEEQSRWAQLIIQQGKARGLGDHEIQTALMTALAESGLRNVNYGDRDSVGLFQQRTSQGWGSIQQIMDPNYSIGKFYDALQGVGNRNGMSQWQLAQAVQRSAFADGSNYKAQFDKAMGIYQSYSTGAVTAPVMKANGSAEWINANNGRYHDYDGAYGAQCVDLYNFYVTGFAGANPMQSRVTGAKDIWNNYDSRALTRVQANQRPQQGDIVVWGSSWGGGYGHVGIVAGVNPNGTLKVLNANATSAGPRGNTVISNYGMGGVLGFLRPNKLMGK